MPIAKLSRQIIDITGTDTETFLQGQLTADIKKATPEKIIWAAHCNLKGRMISLGQLLKTNDSYRYIAPSDLCEIAMKRLQKYILFSKVKLTLSEDQVYGFWSEKHPAGIEYSDSQQLLITSDDLDTTASESQWQLIEIEKKHAWLSAQTSGQFMPSEIQLAQLGGVSLNKGCFVGQEIIARLHYLGKSKKKLVISEVGSLTKPGEKTEDGAEVICKVQVDNHAQALVLVTVPAT